VSQAGGTYAFCKITRMVIRRMRKFETNNCLKCETRMCFVRYNDGDDEDEDI